MCLSDLSGCSSLPNFGFPKPGTGNHASRHCTPKSAHRSGHTQNPSVRLQLGHMWKKNTCWIVKMMWLVLYSHYTSSSQMIHTSQVFPTWIKASTWCRVSQSGLVVANWTDVSTFRNFLNEWVATQKSDGDMEQYLNAPNQLTWPDLPTAPDYSVPFELGKTLDGEPIWRTGPRFRRTAMEKGQYCFRWERPPQSSLLKKAKNGI